MGTSTKGQGPDTGPDRTGATTLLFTRPLREAGFELDFKMRVDGTTMREFKARRGDRYLTVQIWSDGTRRVARGHFTKLPNGVEGRIEKDPPRYFTTPEEMLEAIEAEWTA